MKSKLLVVAVALFLTGSISAQEIPGLTPQEVHIGACTTLSGADGFFGVAMTQAAQAYFTLLNEHGGIHARQIVLDAADDQYDVGESTACFKEHLSGAVFASGFPIATGPSEKYVQLAAAEGMPILGFFAPGAYLSAADRHAFALRPGYNVEADAMIEHLSKELGVRRVGVIFQKDAQGDEMMRAVRDVLRRRGASMKSAAGGAAIKEKEDIDKAIGVLRAGNPDAVILALSHDLAADLVGKAKTAGWSPLFVGFSTMGAELFVREAGAASEGVVIGQAVPSPGSDSKLRAVQLYRQVVSKYAPKFNPSYPGFQGFVDALVIAAALKDAGDQPTRERFLAALNAMRKRDIGLGPDSPLELSRGDHDGLHRVYFTVVENHRLEPLTDWRKQLAYFTSK